MLLQASSTNFEQSWPLLFPRLFQRALVLHAYSTMVVSAFATFVQYASCLVLGTDDAMPQSNSAVSFGSLLHLISQLTAEQSYTPPAGYSVQILYQTSPARNEHGKAIQMNGWSTFFVPRGQPVNPCAIPPFSRVHHTSGVGY